MGKISERLRGMITPLFDKDTRLYNYCLDEEGNDPRYLFTLNGEAYVGVITDGRILGYRDEYGTHVIGVNHKINITDVEDYGTWDYGEGYSIIRLGPFVSLSEEDALNKFEKTVLKLQMLGVIR